MSCNRFCVCGAAAVGRGGGGGPAVQMMKSVNASTIPVVNKHIVVSADVPTPPNKHFQVITWGEEFSGGDSTPVLKQLTTAALQRRCVKKAEELWF